MDAGERALLDATVRDALERAARDPYPKPDDALAALGWLEMLDAEPRTAIDIVLTALGTTNASATVLDDVIVAALGVEPRADLAVLLPAFATWTAPGRTDHGLVRAEGLASARITTATELLVVTAGPDQQHHTITMPVDAITVTRVRGIDPDAGLHLVTFDHSAERGNPLDASAWAAAVGAARRAIGHQIAGASRAMLALACAHASERVQFGRPIARFQAVRHRLADALVAVEALDAALSAAWDEPSPLTAALAKAIAGRTTRTVATHSQQVLAGIGFTTDHAFHRYFKRTLVLEGLFGRADDIVTDIGRELIATRSVPTLIDL